MFLSQTDREILSSLKGRASKLLSGIRKISSKDRKAVERAYCVIDEIILWDKKLTKTKSSYFKKELIKCKDELETSDKKYIQEHVVPLLGKVINQEWK